MMLHEDPPTTETESPAPDGETGGEPESPEEEESEDEA